MIFLDFDQEKTLADNLAASAQTLGWNIIGTGFATDYGTTIDMLAFDNGGVPLIVQFKRNPEDNIALEALSYYNNITGHKSAQADFMMLSKYPDAPKLHWDRARLILFASAYNDYDIDTISSFPITVDPYIYGIFNTNIIITPQYIPVAEYPEEEETAYGQLKDSLSDDNKLLLNDVEQFVCDLNANIKRITIGETIRYYELLDIFSLRVDNGDITLGISGKSYNSQKFGLLKIVQEKIKYGQ